MMKDPNRTAKTVMSAITKTHTPSTPGSRRVGSPTGTNWESVSELLNTLPINTSPRLIDNSPSTQECRIVWTGAATKGTRLMVQVRTTREPSPERPRHPPRGCFRTHACADEHL